MAVSEKPEDVVPELRRVMRVLNSGEAWESIYINVMSAGIVAALAGVAGLLATLVSDSELSATAATAVGCILSVIGLLSTWKNGGRRWRVIVGLTITLIGGAVGLGAAVAYIGSGLVEIFSSVE